MKNQDGSVLLLCLIFMLILIILTGTMAISVNNELSLSSNEHKMVQVQYYAESCLEYASYFLFVKGSDRTDINDYWDGNNFMKQEFLEDKFDGLEINSIRRQELGGDNYKLTCNINYRGVNETLAVSYHIEPYVGDVYKKAIASGGNIHFKGKEKGEINGDVHTKKSIKDINDPDSSEMDFNGEIAKEQDEDIIPSYDYYFNNTFDTLEIVQNDAIILNFADYTNKIKKVNDSSVFGGKLTTEGLGILIVNGRMTVRNQAKINKESDDFLIIICDGDVFFEDIVEGKFLLYSSGQVHCHDKVYMEGTIIAENGKYIYDDFYIDYDNSYLDTFIKLGVPIPVMDSSKIGTFDRTIIDWQEFIN